MRNPAAMTSAALHVGAVILLFSLTFQPPVLTRALERVHLLAPPPTWSRPVKDNGGGQRETLPASRGRPPKMADRKVWVPPMVVRNEDPKLIVEQALLEAPSIDIQSPVIGDPLGKSGARSGGPGGPYGIGDGPGIGIGPGPGPGVGGPPVRASVRITKGPQVLYIEEPEYSEEARKARFQGKVTLAIEVDTNGRPVNIRVVHGLGLGLDEKAVAAVGRWKFRPAISGDRPVIASAIVEVSFRLL